MTKTICVTQQKLSNMKNLDLDLIETLKNCPVGTKLYSPIFGEVLFYNISDSPDYPIEVKADGDEVGFTKEGKYISGYENGECLLFPSKEQHDWSKFKIPKPDLPIDTPVMTTNSIHEGWYFRYYAGNGKVWVGSYKSTDNLNITSTIRQRYIIPFNKFDVNDMESSIKNFNYGTD